MKKLILILLLMATPAYADYLGCFEPNEAVEIKTLYLNSTGVLIDPTSPACDILDPNDTTLTACTSGPTKVGTLTGIYESSHTIPASPLEGVWIVKQKGTIDGVVKEGSDTLMVVDVAGECPGRAGVKISDPAVDAIWNEAQSGHTTAGTFGKYLDDETTSRLAPTVEGRTVDVTVGGTVGVDFSNTEGTVTATLEDDAITDVKIDDTVEKRFGWVATVDLTGNTGTWDLSLNAEGVSVTDQFKGMILSCGNESREIVASVNGTPDRIKTEPFNIWPAAPTSSACVVRAK